MSVTAIWAPYLLTVFVAGAFLWRSRQPPKNPALLLVGCALTASFCFSTGQILLMRAGIDNTLLQVTWPVVTAILLLFGLAHKATDAAGGTAMILMLAFLLGVSATTPEEVLRDGALVRIVAAVIVAWVLWQSWYHRTGLEVGIWIYYLVPAPALVVGMVDPAVAVPVWWFSRGSQLVGLLVLLGWLRYRRREAHGLPPYQSPSDSPSPLSSGLPEPSTGYAPSSPTARKPTAPSLGSTI